MRKLGSELVAGDVIELWGRQDRITELVPYTGPLAYLWEPEVARLATMAISKTGVTIEPQLMYEVF